MNMNVCVKIISFLFCAGESNMLSKNKYTKTTLVVSDSQNYFSFYSIEILKKSYY